MRSANLSQSTSQNNDGIVLQSAEVQQYSYDITMLHFCVPLKQCEVTVSVSPTVRLSDGFVSHSAEVQQSLVLLQQYYALLLCAITTVSSASLSHSTCQTE